MALARTLSSLRASVLSKVRLPVQGSIAEQSLGAACSLNIYRAFAEGTYLDKSQVTDRIISVTKNFGKADAAKVRSTHQTGTHQRLAATCSMFPTQRGMWLCDCTIFTIIVGRSDLYQPVPPSCIHTRSGQLLANA